VNFRVAGDAVDRPFVEIHQRSCFAQQPVGRIRIVEEFDRERVHVEMGRRHAALVAV